MTGLFPLAPAQAHQRQLPHGNRPAGKPEPPPPPPCPSSEYFLVAEAVWIPCCSRCSSHLTPSLGTSYAKSVALKRKKKILYTKIEK